MADYRARVVDAVDVNARDIARADPSLVLEGAAPRLIDEWQIVPDIWNHVRRAVDDTRRLRTVRT